MKQKLITEHKEFVLYTHTNKHTKQVFYVGSGRFGRHNELSKSVRGPNYHLYCKNIGLIKQKYSQVDKNGAAIAVAYDVQVDIIDSFNTKQEALCAEYKLINEKYGIWPLINTLASYQGFINNPQKLTDRSNKVSQARSIKAVNLFDGKEYTSLMQMAKENGIIYSTIQKRSKLIMGLGITSYEDCKHHRISFNIHHDIYPVQILS